MTCNPLMRRCLSFLRRSICDLLCIQSLVVHRHAWPFCIKQSCSIHQFSSFNCGFKCKFQFSMNDLSKLKCRSTSSSSCCLTIYWVDFWPFSTAWSVSPTVWSVREKFINVVICVYSIHPVLRRESSPAIRIIHGVSNLPLKNVAIGVL